MEQPLTKADIENYSPRVIAAMCARIEANRQGGDLIARAYEEMNKGFMALSEEAMKMEQRITDLEGAITLIQSLQKGEQ